MKDNPINLIYIHSPGHTGSTLLNICLHMHSNILGVSEIVALNREEPFHVKDQSIQSLPFWKQVSDHYSALTGFSFGRVPFSFRNPAIMRSDRSDHVRANYDALVSALTVSGKSIVADASKDMVRFEELVKSNLFKVKLIYLVRNEMAVLNSYNRKYQNWFHGLRKIIKFEKNVSYINKNYPEIPKCFIKYEEMAEDTETVIRSLCNFCEIDFEKSMLSPDSLKFPGIGGNRMREKPIKEITTDESWRNEKKGFKHLIARILLSPYNIRHGYWP